MQLNSVQRERIARFAPAFRRFLDADQEEYALARQARHELYAQLLSPDALNQLGELELGQIVSSLWASRLWGNKGYLVEKLIRDNGLAAIASNLRALLWGRGEVGARYDAFRKAVKGLGAASITELLAFAHPESCGVWNDVARHALDILGFRDDFPPLRKMQISGVEYRAFNALLALIRAELEQHGLDGLDLLDMNYFMYSVWEVGRSLTAEAEAAQQAAPSAPPADIYREFDHDDVVDQLINVGQWLGFQAEKEKLVARGAKVDAVWQARIANLGVVTYVFEVQRRGSVDSLILNLQRAQNNPTVQRLIVVANTADIERIRQEISSLPESFRKSVGYMEVRDTMRAAELIDELSGIIGKLELVRSEFGV